LAPAQVKATVDSFGAHGIDIDYEAESASQWDAELVRTNVIRYLRQAMPSPQYQIFLTIGGVLLFYSPPAIACGTDCTIPGHYNLAFLHLFFEITIHSPHV
jgi:hypothetical protein